MDVIAPPAATKRTLSVGVVIALVVWVSAAVAGTGYLVSYKQKAGPAAAAPKGWPADTHVKRDPGRPTLVMIVHPKCTCSRASVGELSKLMTQLSGRMAARVLFVRPAGVEGEWENTDLYRSASAIAGVEVEIDRSGAEAERFGALTSGQTYLYAPDGRLLFSGGITQSRGHHGDNAGSKTITAIVSAGAAGRGDQPTTDVYGCGITDPNGPAAKN